MTRSGFIGAILFMVLCLALLVAPLCYGAEATQVGNFKCVNRAIQGDDYIQVLRMEDPDNPFITIYFTRIESGQWMALANPSNTSIATRLIGEIPIDKDGKQIIDKSSKVLGKLSQSIGTKEMKIARSYDPQKNALVYIIYSTKWLEGSLKHSISVVPLGNPLTPK
jgi:CreA protein